MSQMRDAYKNGVYIALSCNVCGQTVFTPVVESELQARDIADDWEELHVSITGHIDLSMNIHYHA